MRNKLYSKLFLVILSTIFIISPCFAENWQDATIRGKEIYIDTDSVNSRNDSLYYNVKYYDKNSKVNVVATIQSQKDQGRVVLTCKFSDYSKNKNLANPFIDKVPASIFYSDIQLSSLLYNANEMAKRALYIKEYTISEPKISTSKGTGSGMGSGTGSKSATNSKYNKEPNFDYFMRKVQKNIKQNWHPPQGAKSKRVVVLFTLNHDGHLISCQLLESSGNDTADREAIWAIQRTYFGNLPSGYKGSYIDISFTFDYNVIDKQ